MTWSERQQAGFALAATAQADPGAWRALGGLAPDIAAVASGVAARIAALDTRARRAFLREVLRPPPLALDAMRALVQRDASEYTPRALALLAEKTKLEPALARRWLTLAAPRRAGYLPDPRLTALLAQVAARGRI